MEKLSFSRRAIWHPVSLMWFIVLMLVFIFSGRSLEKLIKGWRFQPQGRFCLKRFLFSDQGGVAVDPIVHSKLWNHLCVIF